MHWRTILLDLFGAGTWGAGGNMVAWVLCGVLTAVGTYLLRHQIGRRVAAFWAVHHGPHAIEQHKQALREHEAEKQRGKDGTP